MAFSYDDLLRPFHDAMKPSAEFRIGAEAEKFGVDAETGAPIPYEGERGVRTILERLIERHGWARVSEVNGGPLIALERNDASVTLEPGGQLELSGAPLGDIHAIDAELREHLAEVEEASRDLGLAWLGVGFHPFATQEVLPWVPKLRYEVMKVYLPTRGNYALDMMRRTATVQANFDYASEEDAMRKLRVSLRISPLVTAMMANSPFFEGAITGERSHRARVWLSVDPDRQGLLPSVWHERSTLRDYVEWALDVPMFLIKRDGKVVHNTGQTFRAFLRDGFDGHRATAEDWTTHLNTLFPEVRLKKTLEVRGGDSLPRGLASALPALWTGILYDETALAEAEAMTADWKFDEVEATRPAIADRALRASFRGMALAEFAQRLVTIAVGGLERRKRLTAGGNDESRYLSPLARLVEYGRCPADDLVEGLSSDDPTFRAQVLERSRV